MLTTSTMSLKRSASHESVFMRTAYVSSPQSVQLSLHTYCGRLMMDRASQTPQEWEEIDKRKVERKINDHFDIIKATTKNKQAGRVQTRTSKNGSDGSDEAASKDDVDKDKDKPCKVDKDKPLSPTSTPATLASPQQQPKQAPLTNAAVSTTITKSGPIAIPNKLALELSNYRTGNSIEELNQIMENMTNTDNSVGDRIPEGHRAPVVELLSHRRVKTAKTQTLNSMVDALEPVDNDADSDDSCPSGDVSRSESPVSPGLSRPSSTEPTTINESNHVDYSSSPKINKFLTREPPDGCEKVKIVNEDARRSNSSLPLTVFATRPLKPSDGFVLLPSRSSAFLPIPKSNYINSVSVIDSIKNEINKFK